MFPQKAIDRFIMILPRGFFLLRFGKVYQDGWVDRSLICEDDEGAQLMVEKIAPGYISVCRGVRMLWLID